MLKKLAQVLGYRGSKKEPSLPMRFPLPPENLFRFKEADKRIRDIRSIGVAFTTSQRGNNAPEAEGPRGFSLEEVQAAIATDSYLRQALGKYVDLIFKDDWSLKSANEKAVEYLKMRLDIIAVQTGIPTRQLMRDIGDSLVKYHNVFIAKVRSPHAAAPPGFSVRGVDGKHPIGGYFLLPPATMRIARKWNGEVVRYEQWVGGQDPVSFKPDEIIHIAYTREIGYAFGMPYIVQVIDDVRMLREVEYNVSRLLYLYLHPLYIMSVGKDEPGKEPTPEEMAFIQEQTRDMELGGMLYLPGDRYALDVKGAQGEALNPRWALDYFERRVLSGLGTPETAFGRGDAVNRATADQLTAEMHDRAQAYQQAISLYVEEFIFRELLMEAGFDPLFKPEDRVFLSFQNLRTDEIIKQQNHAIFKYEHNAVTFDEMRAEIGMEPLLPEQEQGLHLYKITIPKLEAEARIKGGASEDDGTSPETDNRNKPRNQHGTKPSPGGRATAEWKQRHETLLCGVEERLQSVLDQAKTDLASVSPKERPWVFEAARRIVRRFIFEAMFDSLLEGLNLFIQDAAVQRRPLLDISQLASELEARAERDIVRIMDTWANGLQEPGKNKEAEAIYKKASLSTMRTASFFMAKATWYGYAKAAASLQKDVFIEASDDSCEACKLKDGKKVPLVGDVFSAVPAMHPHCGCRLRLRGVDIL